MPLVHVLLPNEEKETYTRIFKPISTFAAARGLAYNPPEFRLDFEIGMVTKSHSRTLSAFGGY